MTDSRIVIPGVVRNGVVIPKISSQLPEGAAVEILVDCMDVPEGLRDEFSAWERASDEAWRMIDEWEREEQS